MNRAMTDQLPKRWIECFKNLVNLTRLVESESHPCSLQMRCSSNDGVMFFCLLFLCFMKVSPCNYIQLIAVPPLHNSTQLSRVKTRFRWVSFPKTQNKVVSKSYCLVIILLYLQFGVRKEDWVVLFAHTHNPVPKVLLFPPLREERGPWKRGRHAHLRR